MEIIVGAMGKIIEGEEAGSYVKVIDDRVNTGGFLILTSLDADFHRCFDGWVEDLDSLQGYFKEAGWKVEWL